MCSLYSCPINVGDNLYYCYIMKVSLQFRKPLIPSSISVIHKIRKFVINPHINVKFKLNGPLTPVLFSVIHKISKLVINIPTCAVKIHNLQSHKQQHYPLVCKMVRMGPLQLAVTWYKIRHAGEQAVHWDIQNKATSSRQICIFFVLDVPVRSLLSSMADFVPCDRQLQRAHFSS